MEIDGDIWILLDKGNVVRYKNGEQVPFAWILTDLAEEPVDMVVTTGSTLIYLADGGGDWYCVRQRWRLPRPTGSRGGRSLRGLTDRYRRGWGVDVFVDDVGSIQARLLP
jgi:hypothetical protein